MKQPGPGISEAGSQTTTVIIKNLSSPKTLRLQCCNEAQSGCTVSAHMGTFKGAAIVHKDRHILVTCLDANSEKG